MQALCHHVFKYICQMRNDKQVLQADRHHVFRYIFPMENDDHMRTDTRKARFAIRGVACKFLMEPY